MSEEVDIEYRLSNVARSVWSAKALIEHAYGIGSFVAFRQLPESTQRTYLSVVYEFLHEADWELDRLRKIESDPRRNPVEVRE